MDIASAIKAFASLLWLGILGLIVLAVTRASRGRPIKQASSLVIGGIALAVVVSILGMGLVFLQPEERGVVISPYASQGYRQEIMGPGLHWVIPGETVRRYAISNQTYTMSIAPDEGSIYGDDSITARTSDGQEIYVDASVIFSVDPARVIDVHIVWQGRYIDELVRPLTRGIIRDAVSQYGVEQVVTTKRAELVSEITETMRTKLEENGIILYEFILRNITFSQEYADSVEQKQIAEQLALQAEFIVEQRIQEAEQARQVAQGQADAVVIAAQAEAEATIVRAEAQAEALRLVAEVLAQNPSLLTYEYIQKLAPNVSVMYLPSDTPLLLPSITR
jgi:regulator of protease activity HflC (stomatin/prohibitin superfamily)